jgi:hypothetical protein
MLRYEELLDTWFFVRVPKGISFDEFERQDAIEDREKSRNVLTRMEVELPRTCQNIFNVARFEWSLDVLARIDLALDPPEIANWINASDPNDPNNFFKLTVSEIAVYFGELLRRKRLDCEWGYARFPNYFQSAIVIRDVAIHVFDTVIKRCSRDYQQETLLTKWETFQRITESASSSSDN